MSVDVLIYVCNYFIVLFDKLLILVFLLMWNLNWKCRLCGIYFTFVIVFYINIKRLQIVMSFIFIFFNVLLKVTLKIKIKKYYNIFI